MMGVYLLSRVQPRYTQHSHAETSKENEEERDGNDTELVRVAAFFDLALGGSDDDPANGARRSRGHHNFSSTVPLNNEVCQTSEDQIIDRASSRQNAGQERGNAERVDENVAHVVRSYLPVVSISSHHN